MNAPKRLLDEPEAMTPIERDLLRSGLAIEPPPESQAEAWAALLAQLPPGGGTPSPSGGGASSAGAKASAVKAGAAGGSAGTGAVAGAVGGGILKSALLGAGSAVALIAGYAAVTSLKADLAPPPPAITAPEAPSPRAATRGEPLLVNPPAPDATEAPAPPAAPPRAAEARPPSGAAATEPSSKAEPAADRERESRLHEESQRLSEARDALRRGDAASALGQLEELGRKFPGGVLVQEREALTIEALYKSGQRERAAARASAFLSAYPTSPHAPRIQAFTQ
jgi:TolA-binding protein